MQRKSAVKPAYFKFTPPVPAIVAAITKGAKGDLNEVKRLLNTTPNLISQVFYCSNLALNPPVPCNISLLDLAAGLGKTEILLFLLEQKRPFKLEQAFYFAAQNGHLESVEILLKKNIDITHENYKALRISVSKKHEKITQCILNSDKFDHEKCRKTLDKNKDSALLNLLRDVGNNNNNNNNNNTIILRDFVALCKNRKFDALKTFINNDTVNLKADNGLTLITASQYLGWHDSDIEIINLLLQKGSNPCDQNYKAIVVAFCKRNFPVTTKLIDDKRVNLNDNDFELIFLLANSCNMPIPTTYGYYNLDEQLRLLAQLLGRDTIARKKLFESACEKQKEKIVSMMLDQKTFYNTRLIDYTENNFEAIRLVLKHFKDVNALSNIVSVVKNDWHFSTATFFGLIVESGNDAFYKIWTSNDNCKNIKDSTLTLTKALCSASKLGHANMVTELLTFPNINPTTDNNQAIQNAINGNHMDIVRLLLKHPKCTLKTVQLALVIACKEGRLEIVSELIKFKDLDLAFDDNFLIRQAAQHGWNEIFLVLFNNPFVDITAKNNAPIRLSCEYNHTNITKLLLRKPEVDPTVENNICIYYACNNGNLEVVQLLLAERGTLISKPNRDKHNTDALLGPLTQKLLMQYRVDPSADNNRALIVTCKNGHDEILVELLKDKRVNPSDQKNVAFLSACDNNHPKVVKILLQYDTVVPFTHECEGIRSAYNKNHFEIIEIILNSNKMPVQLLGFSDHWLLQTACEKGHTAAVKILLDKIQIQLIHNGVKQNSLLHALKGDHVNVFALLLKDGRFDPTFEANHLIQLASKSNKLAFIKLLMDDGRADPTDNNYQAISDAYSQDYREVFEQLLLHNKVDSTFTFNHNWLIFAAAKKNDTELVMGLLKKPEVNPTDEQHCALKVAYTYHRDKDIFKQLLEDKRSNVHFENNWLLCEAAKINDKTLLERLLKSPKVKSPDVCYALKGAYTNDHKEICDTLLTDHRINLAFEDNWLLTEASGKNDISLIMQLLNDEQVAQSSQIPAIEKAYEKGCFDIINIIIKNKKPAFLEKLLEIACDKNYVNLVTLLLENPQLDPSFKDNFPIRLACEKGREKIVNSLLLHEKVDPSACRNEAFRIACKNGFLPIVEALLKEEKVNPQDCNQEAISNAISNNHNPILSRLLLERRVYLDALTPINNVLNENSIEIILKNSGLHFGLMPDKLKNTMIQTVGGNLKAKIMIRFKEDKNIITIDSIEELKNSWFRFNIQDLMLLYAGAQKPFWNISFTDHCSTENAFLTRQIEEQLALSFASLFEEEKKKHKENDQGIALAYQTILDYTEKLRSVNSNFYFDWLCKLGSDYSTAISNENSVTSYKDDAINTFKVVYQEAAPFITTLELYIRGITTNPNLNNEQTRVAFNIAKHCQYMLDKSIEYLEIAIMAIVCSIQEKMRVVHNMYTSEPKFNPDTNLIFLKQILNIFDKFTNLKNNHPLVLSCVQRIFSPFFIDYLIKNSIKNTTQESFDKLSLLELISVFEKLQTTDNGSKKEENTKPFTPLYQQTIQNVPQNVPGEAKEKSEISLNLSL